MAAPVLEKDTPLLNSAYTVLIGIARDVVDECGGDLEVAEGLIARRLLSRAKDLLPYLVEYAEEHLIQELRHKAREKAERAMHSVPGKNRALDAIVDEIEVRYEAAATYLIGSKYLIDATPAEVLLEAEMRKANSRKDGMVGEWLQMVWSAAGKASRIGDKVSAKELYEMRLEAEKRWQDR